MSNDKVCLFYGNLNENVFESSCTIDEIRGGGKANTCREMPYSHKTVKCEHAPDMYSKVFDSAYGERTLYFCLCDDCKISTQGYLNPIEAVHAWDDGDIYSDGVTKYDYDMKLVYG